MPYLHNSDAGFRNGIENEVLSDWEAAVAGTQIFTTSTGVRIVSKEREMADQKHQ